MKRGCTRGRIGARAVVGCVLALVVMLLGAAPALANGVPLVNGDVLAGVGDGQVKNFSPTGTLQDTLSDGTSNELTTGMCFDSSSNLYVTEFESDSYSSTNQISKYSPAGNLLASPLGSGFSTNPESCAVDAHDHIFIGGPAAPSIDELDTSGKVLASFSVAPTSGTGGTDWIDLAADECSIYYTGEGSEIKRYNVCTKTQESDLATGLPGPCFALRIRPNGETMVTCGAEVLRLDSSGNTIQTYPIPGASQLFAMNLDPDGTSFWTGDVGSGEIYHVDIATGDVINQFNSSPATQLAGLAVVGELRAAQQSLTTSVSADLSSVAPGAADGYTITISNPNSTSVSLSDITDTLPDGFTYTTGSSSGATLGDPAGPPSSQTLTWSGPFTVPANGSVTLHFNVTVSSTPGTYYDDAGADSSSFTVQPADHTAPVTVTAPVLRSTSTTVSCSPSAVAVGSPSRCTATVTDTDSGTATTPTGSVSFSADSGTFDQGSCQLVQVSTGVASCSVTYTPSTAGVHTITGGYGGDGTHATSSGQGSVTALGPLTMQKTAQLASVPIGGSDSYTITISNPNSSDVSLSEVTDTLPAGFSYTMGSSTGATVADPTVSGQQLTWSGPIHVPGNQSVALRFGVTVSGTRGVYYNSAGGQSTSAAVNGVTHTAPVTVHLRVTGTRVSCAPNPVASGGRSTCTVKVSDLDSGTRTAPKGTVLLVSSGSGSFSPRGSCVLASRSATSAWCVVHYVPSGAGARRDIITAKYRGDAVHAKSRRTTSLSVTAPAKCSSDWCIVASNDGPGADGSGLYAVSCPSVSVCEAVGGTWASSSSAQLVERWQNGKWAKPEVLGRFQSSAVLQGVSCWSGSDCFAVGVAGLYQVIERYHDGSWSEDKTAPHVYGQEPAAVSCPRAGWCMAVGFHQGPFAEEWNGSGWHVIQTDPAARGTLYAVSCTSPSDCVAAGEAPNDFNPPITLVERWNGKTWKRQATPNFNPDFAGNRLYGVSCVRPSNCTAVGSTGALPLVEHWDGSQWKASSLQQPSVPGGGQLRAIDCPAAGSCEAVGYRGHTGSSPYAEPLAERQGWTPQSVENPADNFGAWLAPQANGTIFSGAAVSCPATTWCMAGGEWQSYNASADQHRWHTLAERYAP